MRQSVSATSEPPIVLYDGVCNLCARSVRFIIRRDPRGHFRFASLQSVAGEALRRQYGIDEPGTDSMVLIEDGQAYLRSTAALKIARRLAGAWPVLTLFLIVPRPLRDACYNFIARNRHRWFGRPTECLLPGPETEGRFIDAEPRAPHSPTD